MKGDVIIFDQSTNSGKISGHDGNRYSFVRQDWHDNLIPVQGMTIDFVVEGNQAKEIFLLKNLSTGSGNVTSTTGNKKDKTTAGLLALFLGGLGIHHFYLGNGARGVIYLLFFWTFVPAIIAFIEGIIILTQDESVFNAKYNK